MKRWHHLTAFVVGTALAGCGAPRARPPVAPAPPSLQHVALDGLEHELRDCGYRLGAETESAGAATLVASREGRAFYLTLRVESSRTADGHKLAVRLGVFSEPGRKLSGEIAPNATSVGAVLAPAARSELARGLGRRAAVEFSENFAASAR